MAGILAAITAVAGAIGKVFGYAQQKDAEKNAAPVVAAKVAQAEQDEAAGEAKATAGRDLAKSREELSEN